MLRTSTANTIVPHLQAAEQLRIRAEVKGDVVTQLLPLVDSFELARGQLQPQTDGEQKIDSAYQVTVGRINLDALMLTASLCSW